MDDPATSIPCSLPEPLSGKWYVLYDINGNGASCVRECDGTEPSCKGRAENYQELYSTFDQCCKEHLWWMLDSPCSLV
jgi:hypothetical protein